MVDINISNLHIEFQESKSPFIVLDGVSFNAKTGEFVCLVGPSGCGKTTMLNAIAGLVEYNGIIEIKSEGINNQPTISYVFQTPRLLNWLTIKENVIFPLEIQGFGREIAENIAEKYLHLVGIANIQKKYPLDCSGGERARGGIARALCIEPDLILMDEPFSHLDEITARKMRKELLQIWEKQKKTIFFVTHNALEAVFLADKIYILSDKPTKIKNKIEINLSRPRSFEDTNLINYQKRVLSALGVK